MLFSPHFRGSNGAGLKHTHGAQDWRKQLKIGAKMPTLPC